MERKGGKEAEAMDVNEEAETRDLLLCSRSWDAPPVLQLVHAGVGRTADAGDLLPLLPLWQLLGDQLRQQGLGGVQEVRELDHHVLTDSRRNRSVRAPASPESPEALERSSAHLPFGLQLQAHPPDR